MFTARLTESLGAPEGITSRFLIEQKVDLAACPEPLYLARERETGVRRWVKCSDGTEESLERLRNEAQILAGLSHPHLPVLQADASDADEPHLVFPWQAEVSLAKKELADLSAPDRARIAEGLVQVVSYLQAEKPPVSHNRMELDNFWVSPEILWPKLWGFGYAQAGAAVEQLRADRSATWDVITRLLAPGEGEPGLKDELGELGAAWIKDGRGAQEGLSKGLMGEFLALVTADL